MKRQYRYPGASPFEINQQPLFFGRERDIEALYRMIKLERMVVLYSKSGLGKSSLLNAGIIPNVLADDRYQPVRIRFNAWSQGRTDTPLNITRLAVAPKGGAATFLDNLIQDEPSLWHELKEWQIQQEGRKGIMLIFDQFEELFTYPTEAVAAFRHHLAEVIYTHIPDRYSEVLEKQFDSGDVSLTSEEINLLQQPVDLKIVMAIRSDRMHLLEQLSSELPTILKTCYELEAMDIEQARTAIVEPARYVPPPGFELRTPVFHYAPATLDKMLAYLTKDGKQRPESFQLQILCQSVEKKITQENQLISPDDLGNVEEVYENYYEDQLGLLEDADDLHAARILIEEALVFEEEERRISVYEGQIHRQYGLSKDGLQKLVDSHLLRAEPSLQGGYTYELCHDTLVGPVLKAKKRRREGEQAEAETRARRLREAELAKLRAKAKEEEQKREEAERLRDEAERLKLAAQAQEREAQKQKRRAYVFTILSLGLMALSLIALIYALDARGKAQSSEQRAIDNATLAQKNLEELKKEQQQRLQIQASKDEADARSLVQRADELAKARYYRSARQLYEEALELISAYPTHPDLAQLRSTIQASKNSLPTSSSQ